MRFSRKIRAFFRKGELEAEMADEMRAHLELLEEENRRRGMAAEEAHYAALRSFGGLEQVKEQARDQSSVRWLEDFLRDLRFAWRELIKSPGFSLLAVVTLALGIGVNSAMFTVLDGIILRPLPYPGLERIDRFFRATPQNPDGDFSPADFRDLKQGIAPYGDVAAYRAGEASLSEPGQPAEMATAFRIDSNLFPLLGVKPQLGRTFRPAEDVHGNDRVVILSQRVWQNRFGGRADIIGHVVRIDGEPHEIVGVMPASFNDWRHFGGIDFFRPLGLTNEQAADRHATFLRVLGRRSGQVTAPEAAAFVDNFGARLARDFPAENAGTAWHVASLQSLVAGDNGPATLALLIGLSGCVLLIACSNLANLLLARTMTRAREFAIRAALGASRLQLLRPLIAESVLLAFAGGACAILVAQWFGDWLTLRSTADNGEQAVFTLDLRVFLWTLGASVVTAIVVGVAPALFALRLDLHGTLKSGARGTIGGRHHQRFRRILIVGQFAIAMVLLAGAALFIRSLNEINHRRAGWDSTHLVSGSVLLSPAKYATADMIESFQRQAVQRLEALPGVASASVSSFTPYFGWPDAQKFAIAGRPPPPRGQEPVAAINRVSPHYFETVGTRLLAGRGFVGQDDAQAPRVLVINQAMARGLFGGENPVGRRLVLLDGTAQTTAEIVGMATDVVSVVPEMKPVSWQIYQPIAQAPRPRCEVCVRTADIAPATVIDSIRATVAGLDPDLPVRNLKTADDTIDRANYQEAVLRDMLSSFALLGLGLASLGIYGVIARAVSQRTGEFAIRLALGASIRDITRLVLLDGVKQALLGSSLGLIGAIGVAQFFVASWPGMHFSSLPVLVGTTLLLILVALLACWLPSRRAGRVDAMVALRAE